MSARAHEPASVLLLPGLDLDGGMARYAQELYSALAALPERPLITVEQPVLRRYASRIFDHRQTRRIDSAWCRYVAYPRSLRHHRAGVFHVLDHGYAQLIRYLDAERTVVTCHDLIPLLAAEGVIPVEIPATVVRTFRWRLAQMIKARAVITPSRATKVMLERYTPVRPQQVVVIPQGVSATFRRQSDGRSATRASAGVPAASRVVLQVATSGRNKNSSLLLHALAQLRSRSADLLLVRIGMPFYADEAALISTLGVGDAVRYLGTVDNGTLSDWYNAADVLAFPSLWEGFGMPVLEAMACGTPVVASNVPAIAEVAADAAILVSPDDPSALASALEAVMSDVALADSLRTKGFARAGHFTWAQTAIRTLQVYNEVRCS